MLNDLSRMLVIGDSHMALLKIFLNKDKYIVNKLSINLSSIHFIAIKGATIRGLTKQTSETNIRQKMNDILEKQDIDTIMICLGFNDINAVYPHKKEENPTLNFHDYTKNLMNQFSRDFLEEYKKKYKIIIQSVIYSPLMDSIDKYNKYLKKQKIVRKLNTQEIFKNYRQNVKYFNIKLEELSKKQHFSFCNNEKLNKIMEKHKKLTTSSNLNAPFHYKPIIYLFIFFECLAGNLRKDKLILLTDYTKYIINNSKSSDTISYCKDLLNYYSKIRLR